MGVQETLTYVLFTNPISSSAGSYVKTAASAVIDYAGIGPRIEYRMVAPEPLWKLVAAAGPYLRITALSGAAAVFFGAYGTHKRYPEKDGYKCKEVFETASRYHYYHTLAMIALPMCRFPFLTASLMLTGTMMFCGTCYYYAFTGDSRYSRYTPIGGTCFLLGWLSMCI